jgi:hypothetical protein
VASTGEQRPSVQICPRGQGAPLPQPQRPLVFVGSPAQPLCWSGRQLWPVLQVVPQPPQFEAEIVTSTHTPLQQRMAAVVPQRVASARLA